MGSQSISSESSCFVLRATRTRVRDLRIETDGTVSRHSSRVVIQQCWKLSHLPSRQAVWTTRLRNGVLIMVSGVSELLIKD